MGCVLPAGLGQAPARQAAHGAGVPWDVGCTTINKMCGSGMKATMLAHDLILAAANKVMLAGGLESMTNAPYLWTRRAPACAWATPSCPTTCSSTASRTPMTRAASWAASPRTRPSISSSRARPRTPSPSPRSIAPRTATEDGTFAREIVPVAVKGRAGDRVVSQDEQPLKADPRKIPTLQPAFREGGTVTAANSSSISDGAAALVLMTEREADKRGLTPRARILGHATHAAEPAWFTTAPVGAIQKLLDKLGWKSGDVDLFEINEAFAVVTMAAMREHDLPHDKVNVHGGACALGHPIGASGARIIVTL